LNEIFDYLKDTKVTLLSCLLVNRLWREVSVQILWRSVWNYNTLIACFSNESKEILYKNEIFIPTPTSNPPLFNYIAFIKNLSIHEINKILKILEIDQSIIISKSLYYNKYIVLMQEIFKMFMSQISLKELNFYLVCFPNIDLITYPGAIDCLKNLSELNCSSDIYSEFFCQISQICHNIQSLNITFKAPISNGIINLISAQQNLKYLSIIRYCCKDSTNMIPLILTKLPDTLIKLDLFINNHYMSLSFITKFTNLRELVLSFRYSYNDNFKDFEKITTYYFSTIKNLKI